MQEAILAVGILGGFFVLRGILATIFFYYLLPDTANCPNCDAITLRIESRGWTFFSKNLRPSWCLACGWHGLLRAPSRPLQADAYNFSQSGQLPESSKKSSK